MGLISGILFGIIFGVALMAGWSRMMSHRSSKRVAKVDRKEGLADVLFLVSDTLLIEQAVDMKLLGSLSREDLMKICGDNFPQWISFPAFEQVKWLNKLLSKMWPFIAELSWEEASHCIRVQSFKEGQITMDVDLRWGGDPNIVLGVTALVASIPIQLKDLQVFTVARVIFQLADEIPCISAVVVALLAEPKPRIDYTLKAVGGSLTAIPGLSDMIDDTVDSIVKDMLQWPHRIVVPIGGIPVDISDLELKPQGKLIVTVVKATNLKNKELIGKSDPYATIHIRPVFKYKTKAIENNLNPVWDQTFELIAEDKETQSLTIEVFDKDVGQDERLGLVKLPLSSLEAGVTKEMELNLLSSLDTLKVKDKKDRGSITLKVHYHEFNKEEQMAALEEEKKIMEERKKLKEAGMIGSTMDAVGSGLGAGVGMVGTGIGAGVGLVGTGVSSGVGMVGSGFGAVGSGLSKAGRFMGRTITGQTSKRSGSSTPVNSESDGSKQQ
ncbi:hypothetical protein Bca4012_039941 [Brassica carinata]